ncbi:TlpA family protein disulfide reductase [Sphingomonas oligophenolica]|uniref:TlpA family protein disulfide reductase n=1 Tax=Sphingomonas oligophenolica TaxID=301154 RepID=A0A502CUI7_9SPHN|nr:TlpA disulfide reductase family protein [Sphingomonas oligophenolica]TPG15411.1 TlpA family protein disulfide reductase [Sphingomonas oligophenolica]
MPFSSSRLAIASLLIAATGIAGCDRQSDAPAQANVADATTATADDLSSDEVVSANSAAPAAPLTGIDRSHKGDAAPTAEFKAPDGKPTTLAAFRGKPVLLNLWATWCGPCVAELPTLNAAAAALDGKVAVLAISQDTQNTKRVPQFLADHGATALAPYVDDQMALSLGYGANLPTTILFDSAGKEVWRWHGGNDWTSPAVRALIAEAS